MSDPATTPVPADTPRSVELTVLIFTAIIGATALVAALGGLVAGGEADPWYAALDKAPGNPPGFVFALVWPALYALMAIGACLVWNATGSWKRTDGALGLFFVQLVPNLAWSWLFFGINQPLLALIDIAILWILVALMIREFHRHSALAAVMQYPYLAWLSFATYLNAWVVFAN
ncbi:MAG TPA: TspO/MBR family protein [Hyphomonadaceae bacterium]|nr:TspO/MBR family protein [Hyphomonadaceae bacterium]